MTFWRQFKLLLWKNVILQRRRKCVCLIEVILPLLMVVFLLAVRNSINLAYKRKMKQKDWIPPIHSIGAPHMTRTNVGYAPTTPIIETLMKYMEEANEYENSSSERLTFKGFTSRKKMEKYAQDRHDEVGMCIEIEATGYTMWPSKDVSYTLRPPAPHNVDASWHTEKNPPSYQSRLSYFDEYGVVNYFQMLIMDALIKCWCPLLKQERGAQKLWEIVELNFSSPLADDNEDTAAGSDDDDDDDDDDDAGGSDGGGGNRHDCDSGPVVKVMTEAFKLPRSDKSVMTGRTIVFAVPDVLVHTLLVMVVVNTKNLVDDKEKKLKESMKLFGVRQSAYVLSWAGIFVLVMLPLLLLEAIFLAVPTFWESGALVQATDFGVFLLFLLVYGASTITFSFMLASLAQKGTTAAVIAGVVFYLTYFPAIPIIVVNYDVMPRGVKLGLCLLANCAMVFGCKIMGVYEERGEGVHWYNINTTSSPDDNLTLLDCIGMLVLDSILYLLVWWYMDNINPGDYGVPLPYNFCFTKSYWLGATPQKMSRTTRGVSRDIHSSLRFEPGPPNLQPGIEIQGLTKIFGKETAVDRLSLTMYEGQITALLGHNGAGKTTTIAMLTGYLPPTSGTATVCGYDITKDFQGIRSIVGLCPQHNIHFDLLTVQEHLEFFACLKSDSGCHDPIEVDTLLREFDLSWKRFEPSMALSGGLKRKLSLAIALVGDAKILFLDEPTAGMDPVGRRQTWDYLQKHRVGRTVVLTTHQMEEADILGDRIAIMAQGVLKCCGTSLFLKKLYGAIYRLVLVRESSCSIPKLRMIIRHHVKAAQLQSVIDREVSFLLPDGDTDKFPGLLIELENRKEELGISSFGASATTLEEVFLKISDTNSLDYLDDDKVGSDDSRPASVVDLERTPHGSEEECRESSSVDPTNHTTGTRNTTGVKRESSADPSSRDRVKRGSMYGRGDFAEEPKGILSSLAYGKARAVLMKKALYTWRTPLESLVQLLLPVTFVSLVVIILTSYQPLFQIDPRRRLNLSEFASTMVPVAATKSGRRLLKKYKQEFHPRHTFHHIDMSKWGSYNAYVKGLINTKDRRDYMQTLVVGLELKDKNKGSPSSSNDKLQAIVHYNPFIWHAEAIGMHYLMSALVHFQLDNTYNLKTFLDPLPKTMEEQARYKETQRKQTKKYAKFIIDTLNESLIYVSCLFMSFYIKENITGSKHLQLVCGVGPVIYWLSSFLWDFAVYTVSCTIVLLAIYAAVDVRELTHGPHFVACVLLVLLYVWAVLPCVYLLHFLFRGPEEGVAVLIFVNVFIDRLSQALPRHSEHFSNIRHFVLRLIEHTVPNVCLRSALVAVTKRQRTEECRVVDCSELRNHPCCRGSLADKISQNSSVFSMEKLGVGKQLITLYLMGIVYFLFVFMVEYYLANLHCRKSRVVVRNADEDEDYEEDADVTEERSRLNDTPACELSQTEPLLLVNLTKMYGPLLAVDNVCLGVDEQECMGLLGQNGAGKTTVFNMLTGNLLPTDGNVFVAGQNINHRLGKPQEEIGYCPQSDALIDQLTGRETLEVYARIRGIPSSDVYDVVDALLDDFMLEADADRLVATYSGGNKRKLSTALAIVGMPQVILLDEPSAGMEPRARRHMWTVLSRVRALGHTVLLSSHDMEECEALCTRLVIMVNGRLQCVGSPQHLKSKFGENYTLVAQMGVQKDGTRAPVQPLVDHMKEQIPDIQVINGHEGYVHVRVPVSNVKLGNIFELMETAKQSFLLRGYSVHQCSLEQVFLTVTRSQLVDSCPQSQRPPCWYC